MDIGLHHAMYKEDTRKAFNEFKRIIDTTLFSFNLDVKQELQNQLLRGLYNRTIKYFVTNYKLSGIQINLLQNTISKYKKVVLVTSNNYSKHYL
jgi:hypothetical protein